MSKADCLVIPLISICTKLHGSSAVSSCTAAVVDMPLRRLDPPGPSPSGALLCVGPACWRTRRPGMLVDTIPGDLCAGFGDLFGLSKAVVVILIASL